MRNNGTSNVRQPAQTLKGLSPIHACLKLLRRAGQLFLSIIDIPFRYVFGRDLFISYSHRDSRRYSPNIALALQKRMPKLSVYLDRWVAPPSGKLPLSLRLQLRWSSILVVVCTKNAVGSTFVKDEVARFGKLRRKVVPVDVDGFYSAVRDKIPWLEISGADPEDESGEAVERGEPSEHVIERILKSVEFTTQDRRLRRAVWATLAFVVLSVGGTVLYSYVTIRAASAKAAEAEGRAIDANKKAELAEAKAKSAGQRAADATQREAEAKRGEATAIKARGLSEKQARSATARAEMQRRIADEQAKRAEEEGAKAASRELLAEGQQARYEGDDRFIRPVALALEAYRKYPSFEPDSLFRYGLNYLPRPISRISTKGIVSTLAFSRDGRQVFAAGGWDKWTLQIWDVGTGKELNHPLEVSGRRPLLSHYGQYLAVVSADTPNIVEVLATPDGRRLSTLEHDGPVTMLDFSEDENYILTGSGSTLQVWKVGEKSSKKMAHEGRSVLDASISQDGKIVVSVSAALNDEPQGGYYLPKGDYYLTIWDRETGQPVMPPRPVPSCPLSALWFGGEHCVARTVISRDGRYVAYAHRQTVLVFDLKKKEALKQLDFDSPIQALDILSGEDTYRLAVIHDWGVAKVYDPEGKPLFGYDLKLCDLRNLSRFPQYYYIAFTPGPQRIDNPSLITTCTDNTARLWNGDPIKGVTAAWIQHPQEVVTVAANRNLNGKLFIATADSDGEIRVWEEPERDTQALYQYQPSADSRGVRFSRDRRFVIIPTDKGHVQVIDTGSGQKVGKEINAGEGQAATAKWDPVVSNDGLYLYNRGFVERLWDVQRGEEITPPALKGVPAIPGLRHLAFERGNNCLGLWRTGAATLKPLLLPCEVTRVLISPDEENFVTSNNFGQLRIWKLLEEPAPDGSLRAESARMESDEAPAQIFAESYSRTGRYLITTKPTFASPGTAFSNKLWLRRGDGHPISSLRLSASDLEMSFSSDESRFAVMGDDSSVIVLRTIDGKEIRRWKVGRPICCHFHVALNSTGGYLAVSRLGEISLWDVRSGQRLTKFEYPDDEVVTELAFSPDDKYLLVATDKQVERVLWKVSDLLNEAQSRLLK